MKRYYKRGCEDIAAYDIVSFVEGVRRGMSLSAFEKYSFTKLDEVKINSLTETDIDRKLAWIEKGKEIYNELQAAIKSKRFI